MVTERSGTINITLILVTSVNGRLTREESTDIYEWTSKEDQDYFFSMIKQHALIIMGRKTYEASKGKIRLVPGKLRVVMTRHPERYTTEALPGQLEFSDESPGELIGRLGKTYSQALLVGGNEIAALFLQDHLVNELSLTVEPFLTGTGISLISQADLTVQLHLKESKQLNERGTLLLRYAVTGQ